MGSATCGVHWARDAPGVCSTFRRDEDIELALEAATYGALGLEPYGLAPGAPADLLVVAARTAAEAVVTHPVRELVLKGGRVVARDGSLA
jgi:cytosine/adenosine deaminase-related metal-dependent hydrolase